MALEPKPGFVWDGTQFVPIIGLTGEPGAGLNIKGVIADSTQLPATGFEGEAWIANDTGNLWVWDDGNQAWTDAGPIRGPKGDDGDPGETLKVTGVVADYLAVMAIAAPQPLEVIVTKDTTTMFVYDPKSPVADPKGWVNMGRVQGPAGPPAFGAAAVPNVASLPVKGSEGEMRLVENTGDLWSWNAATPPSGAWVNMGRLRLPAASIDPWVAQAYLRDSVVIHAQALWRNLIPARSVDVPGVQPGNVIGGSTPAQNRGALSHDGAATPGTLAIESAPFQTLVTTLPVGAHMVFTVAPGFGPPYTPLTGSFAGVVFTEDEYWICNTGDPLVGHDGWLEFPKSIVDITGDVAWNAPTKMVWEKIGSSALAELQDTNIPGNVMGGAVLAFENGKWTPAIRVTTTALEAAVTRLETGIAHGISVIDITDSEPPSAVMGEAYIISPLAQSIPDVNDAFAGHANELAIYGETGPNWDFFTPEIGNTHFVEMQKATWTWNGTDWVRTGGAAQGAIVGSVMQTILTEAQFSTAYPTEYTKWVLADGRAVPNTKYAAVTGQGNVPDMRGLFIRAAGGQTSAPLGQSQTDTTRMPRSVFHNLDSGVHRHGANPSMKWKGLSNGSGYNNLEWGGAGSAITADQWTAEAGSHTHAIQGGDPETRPANISLNTFIKIND